MAELVTVMLTVAGVLVALAALALTVGVWGWRLVKRLLGVGRVPFGGTGRDEQNREER